MRLAIAFHQTPQPQAFFVLGGDPTRETSAAEIARWYPSLKIWVSSPPNPRNTVQTFQTAGNLHKRLKIDVRAVDTVTNFTTLVADFQQQKISHIFLITSDFHMRRAKAIATIILGSKGIAFTPLSVASTRSQESARRIIRDVVRSVLWVFTGWTGVNTSA